MVTDTGNIERVAHVICMAYNMAPSCREIPARIPARNPRAGISCFSHVLGGDFLARRGFCFVRRGFVSAQRGFCFVQRGFVSAKRGFFSSTRIALAWQGFVAKGGAFSTEIESFRVPPETFLAFGYTLGINQPRQQFLVLFLQANRLSHNSTLHLLI